MKAIDTEAMKASRKMNQKRNAADRDAGWSQITTNDDPRIAIARNYNAALAALTDAEVEVLESEWYKG